MRVSSCDVASRDWAIPLSFVEVATETPVLADCACSLGVHQGHLDHDRGDDAVGRASNTD